MAIKSSKAISLLCWLVLMVILIITPTTLQVRRLQFKPPLKGTEILMEADQLSSKQRKRGIWALDPEKGKARFLIPDGSRPIWSPKRNYFAYRKINVINVVSRDGTYHDPLITPSSDDGELMGWGHTEQWILFVGPILLGDPTPERRLPPLQTICFASFDPKKYYLFESGMVYVYEVFPEYHCGNPSVSPDDKRIAFEVFKYASGIGKLNSKIAIASIASRDSSILPFRRIYVENVHRLTQLPVELGEINPKWSPDGKKIAFDVIDLQRGRRTTHIINVDGTGLKGLKLSKEEITVTTPSGRSFKKKTTLLRIEEGLVRGNHENELRVLGWLSDNRLIVVETEFALTRFVNKMDNFDYCEGIWIVDFEQRHPPLLIIPYTSMRTSFLCLSSSKKQLAWSFAVGDCLISMKLLKIPSPHEKEAISILHQWWASLKRYSSHLFDVSVPRDLAVYWMNW